MIYRSEAGRANVTLSLDGPRNGPSRKRRREKREAARAEKKAAEDFETLPAVQAEKESESEEHVEKPDDEGAPKLEEHLNAEKATESTEEVKVPLIDDEFGSDSTYRNEPKEMKSIQTQTIEVSCSCGAAAVPERKLVGFDYLSMWPSDYD